MLGMMAPMDCYINNRVACKVKNGERVSIEVIDAVVEFKCNMYSNPMSDVVCLDLRDGKSVNIKIKQGPIKPAVTVMNKDAITTKTLTVNRRETPAASSQGDIRTALRTMKKSADVFGPNHDVMVADGYYFTPTREVGDFFAVDENARLWAVGQGMFPSLKNAILYSYDDIVDFELIEDGSSVIKGGIGRAVVGGVLFGGVGAIVGGATGKKKIQQTCTNLMIKITVNNMDAPVQYIKLISSKTNKDSMIYRGAYRDAQEIISLLQLICEQRNISQNPVESISSSPVDEIRRYKELMDEGIITEEEFLAKKKQMLGL